MELWNLRNLDPPPRNTCKTTAKQIDVKLLHTVVKEGIDYFANQPHLHTEAAMLSRTIYRMKMKFRNAKDFQPVQKLNRALLNYLNMNIPKVLNTFLELVPQNFRNNMYLPTKNMIDYVLVRLQGLGKLLCRILETCKIAAEMQQLRMRLGHFWKMALIILAMVSRIFVIMKSMIKYTCDLYANLRTFSNKLCNSGSTRWLPQDYNLPEYLHEWLDIDWLDLDQTVIEIPDEGPDISIFNLLDDSDEDDIEISDEYFIINDEPSIINLVDDSILNMETNHSKDFIPLDNNENNENSVENVHTETFIGFDDSIIDVGEVVTSEDPIDDSLVIVSDVPTQVSRKRKLQDSIIDLSKTLKNNNNEVIALSESIINLDVINVSPRVAKKKIKTPKRKRKQQIAQRHNETPLNNKLLGFGGVKAKGKKSPANQEQKKKPKDVQSSFPHSVVPKNGNNSITKAAKRRRRRSKK